MNYELIDYTIDLELKQDQCTQIPAVNKMHKWKVDRLDMYRLQ